MLKNQLSCLLLVVSTFALSSCVKEVKDALDESSLAIQCAKLVEEFDEKNDANPDRSCTDIVADLNEIESKCNEYLSDSTKESFAEFRGACEDN